MLRALRPPDGLVSRDQDLRLWQATVADATAICDLPARREGTGVGVVKAIRLEPGRALEVVVEDGTGELVATWPGRTRLPGLELGTALRLTGVVAVDTDGTRRMRTPAWEPIANPYA